MHTYESSQSILRKIRENLKQNFVYLFLSTLPSNLLDHDRDSVTFPYKLKYCIAGVLARSLFEAAQINLATS